MKYGFGVDLGGTTVKIAYFDETGNMLSKWEIPTVTEDNGSHILPDIAASLLAYMQDNSIDRAQLIGIGIGVPGPVNGKGVVNRCINLGWGVFNIQEELSALTGLPVKAGNDANVAALGECWQGAGCGNMVMVTLGTGVGGGIVLDGKPLHGVRGAAGEIGHMVLNRKETAVCGCGKRGCVEQYCSATGIARLTKLALAESDVPSSLRSVEKIMAKDVFDAAKAGDKLASDVLEQVYAYMGEFIANICCVVNPEIVVFGVGVSKAGHVLLDGVKRHFAKWGYHACQDTQFRLATLGNDAGAYGAFKLVAE
jgi:glucokinase